MFVQVGCLWCVAALVKSDAAWFLQRPRYADTKQVVLINTPFVELCANRMSSCELITVSVTFNLKMVEGPIIPLNL